MKITHIFRSGDGVDNGDGLSRSFYFLLSAYHLPNYSRDFLSKGP